MNNIIEINDFSVPELDIYARTSEVQLLRYNEPSLGLFIAESPKVIERACSAGYEPLSFLVEHKDLEGEAKELLDRFPETPVYTAEYEVLVRLTGYALTRGPAARIPFWTRSCPTPSGQPAAFLTGERPAAPPPI